MFVINVDGVNQALIEGMDLINQYGVFEPTRNGPAFRAPMPVATVTNKPTERVLYHAWRDANPFFHLYEALWMFAGRNDIAPLTRFVSRFNEYSDDGVTMNAAYGYRWRCEFETDQLSAIVGMLRSDRKTRHCVLQMWSVGRDLGTVTKDHACNIAATFQVGIDDRLHLTVFCRSNDLIWGAHGANAVHFSMLLEYVALSAGLAIGTMTQVSVNYHAYERVFYHVDKGRRACATEDFDLYEIGTVRTFPLMQSDQKSWDEQVKHFVGRYSNIHHRDFLGSDRAYYEDPFFIEIAQPMIRAHYMFKELRDFDGAMEELNRMPSNNDWRRAGCDWILRRRGDL